MEDLESVYPELKTMKASEIFIEWAYIVKGFKLEQKVHIRRVIPQAEKNALIKALKLVYDVKDASYYEDKLDSPNRVFETVNLVTIER
jgi:hypothetical protein